MRRDDFRYQAFYCEENACHLAADPRLHAYDRWVVFVTNRGRACPFWGQRAASSGDPVVWDYHVFVVARLAAGAALEVFDLDTTLGFPVPLATYVRAAFPGADQWPRLHRPSFRVVSATEVARRFASDRRHMRTSDGEGWQAPPPPWPLLQGADRPHGLDQWLDLDVPDPGMVCDLDRFRDGVWSHAPTVLHHKRR